MSDDNHVTKVLASSLQVFRRRPEELYLGAQYIRATGHRHPTILHRLCPGRWTVNSTVQRHAQH